jgi:hypothetical protein
MKNCLINKKNLPEPYHFWQAEEKNVPVAQTGFLGGTKLLQN